MASQFKDPFLRRYERAEAKRRMWDELLRRAYSLALPNGENAEENTRGSRRDDEIYDGTAVLATKWRRAKLHGDLFPPFSEWAAFEPEGPVADADRKRFDDYASDAVDKFHAAINRSNFHLEVPLAIGDALISTGAILIQSGEPKDPLRFESVPISQYVPEEGPDGIIRNNFRKFRVPARDFEARWEDADIPDQVLSCMESDPDREFEVIECTVYDRKKSVYTYAVIMRDGEKRIVERTYKTSPWVVFRMDKATGETMGRGPVLDALADIGTANKVKELILKNASIDMAGMWQAEDDGVLNFNNIKLEPGVIIPHAAGSEGLQPLRTGTAFDLSQFIMNDLAAAIDMAIKGPSLPPMTDPARTAYELAERRADQLAVELPSSLRLLTELQYPLVMRCLAILSAPGMAGSPYYIPEFRSAEGVIRPRPVSPLAQAQRIAGSNTQLAVLAQVAQLDPQSVMALVRRLPWIYEHLKVNGFPANMLNDPAEVEEAQARAAQQQQAIAVASEVADKAIAAKGAGFDVEGAMQQ